MRRWCDVTFEIMVNDCHSALKLGVKWKLLSNRVKMLQCYYSLSFVKLEVPPGYTKFNFRFT